MTYFIVAMVTLTILASFLKRAQRNTVILSLFVLLMGFLSYISSSFHIAAIFSLGLFLPFCTFLVTERSVVIEKLRRKPNPVYQTATILSGTILLTVSLLLIYKNNEALNALWSPSELKNKNIYFFMSEYYELSPIFAGMVVLICVLISKRLVEQRKQK